MYLFYELNASLSSEDEEGNESMTNSYTHLKMS